MDMNLIDEIVSAMKNDKPEKNHTYSAIVSRIDDEGVVWVNLAGSEKETPTAETSAEVRKGDRVNVEWRNNKLYISGNVSNPSAGVERVSDAEANASAAHTLAGKAKDDAVVAVEKSATAEAVAAQAIKTSENTSQYFWNAERGSDSGVHITEKPQEEFVADPENGGANIAIKSNGISIRQGLEKMAEFASNNIKFYSGDDIMVAMGTSKNIFLNQITNYLNFSGLEGPALSVGSSICRQKSTERESGETLRIEATNFESITQPARVDLIAKYKSFVDIGQPAAVSIISNPPESGLIDSCIEMRASEFKIYRANLLGTQQLFKVDREGNGYFGKNVYINCDWDSSNGEKVLAGCPFPVNGIYMSMDANNPSTIWEGTTWKRISAGRVLVGVKEGDDTFGDAGQTGGSRNASLISHAHAASQDDSRRFVEANGSVYHNQIKQPSSGTTSTRYYINAADQTLTRNLNTASAGSGDGTNKNLQPYLTCYIWQRTA